MKTKTIRKVLQKKTEEWIASVDSQIVREAIARGAFVTGGSIASMLLGEKVNDYDYYFKNKSDLLKVVNYYVEKARALGAQLEVFDGALKDQYIKEINEETGGDVEFMENGLGYFVRNLTPDRVKIWEQGARGFWSNENPVTENSYEVRFITPNAITLSDDIQIVIRFWGEPEEVHKNYDFVHATNYWNASSGILTLHKNALVSLMTKELQYIGSLYPVTSVIRTKKFIQRGWTVSAGTYLKILFQVSELNLYDYHVLEEQLAGVDIAYFTHLIQILKDTAPDKINYNYLCAIIDKIFNDVNNEINED